MRCRYSVFLGSLRSTNFMSFFRLRQISCINDCRIASALQSPDISFRVIALLNISGCSMPPVMCKNFTKDWRSFTELILVTSQYRVTTLQGRHQLVGTYMGVPVRTQRDWALSSLAARATLVFTFLIVCPSSSTTRRQFFFWLSRVLLPPSSSSLASVP